MGTDCSHFFPSDEDTNQRTIHFRCAFLTGAIGINTALFPVSLGDSRGVRAPNCLIENIFKSLLSQSGTFEISARSTYDPELVGR